MGFCDNPLESWAIGISFFGNDQVGIIKLIVGLLYILMAAITIGWINIQARNARNGDNDAVKSVIFPIFTIMMWVSAFTSISVALVILFVPVDLTSRNDSNARWLYPTVFTLQHIVLEGVAFLLMQKGCGKYAAWNASKLMAIWAAITLTANVIGYSPGYEVSIVALLTWDSSLLIFYFLLWILPQNRLFRRPAAIPYAKFWFFFRVVEITLYSMSQVSDPLAAQIGRCGYVFGPLFVFTIFQPIVMYWTLLADSRWWQGVDLEITGRHSIHSPLGGIDISLSSAQHLARTMDELGEQRNTRLLNFAHIEIDRQKLLGQGSFSRVYRGRYRDIKCAIKLIYTMDLTEDVIQRVAAEANILSSMKNPNIVKIYGISVLPPSVCILLELCAFGSLSDILRGDTGGTNKKAPMKLTLMDRLYLALGCAKGLAALHSLGPEVVHRDIKSLNFLVDIQLNAKLADLELGAENNEIASRSALVSDDLLENWAAPELFLDRPYSQQCDIYSLALVMWEIISGKVPFANYPNRSAVRTAILAGERPVMVECPKPYEELIKIGWAQDPKDRPSAIEMIDVLERVLISSCSPGAPRLEALSEIRQLVDSFYQSDCGLEYLNAIKDHRSNYYSRSSSHSFSQALSSSPQPSFSMPPYPSSQKGRNSRTSISGAVTTAAAALVDRGSGGGSVSGSRGSGSGGGGSNGDLEAQDQHSSPQQLSPPASQRPSTSLHDIFDLMFESPSHSILDQLSHHSSPGSGNSLSYQKLMTELNFVYKTIEENDIWKLVDELVDPVLILSAKDPHMILKCSMAWLSMMRCKSSQVFGKILENFIHFPEVEDPQTQTHAHGHTATHTATGAPAHSVANGGSGGSSSVGSNSNSDSSPDMQLHEVISTLEALNQALNSSLGTTSNHFHCILPLLQQQLLVTTQGQSGTQQQRTQQPTQEQEQQLQTILKCSIHCYPIYKKLVSDEEIALETEKPRYFLQRSGRESVTTSGGGGSGGAAQRQNGGAVAFYILYFNHFNAIDSSDGTSSNTVRSPMRSRSIDEGGGMGISPNVSTTEMSPVSSHLSSASMSTNLTEKLRKQGLANDL